MSTQSIAAPFPIFTDLDGQPLEAGYIWIGVENAAPQTNPVAVYWDSALTQPAAQPIRTSNGLPLNNGSPSRIYTASGYSILVQDKRGMLVYSAPSAADLISSDLVTFISSGAGAVTRTVESKLRDWISVRDFGAVGNGVANDTAAFNAALLAHKHVYAPAGTYLLASTVSLQQNGNVLFGDGDATVLNYTGSGTAVNFNGKQYCSVEELKITSTTAAVGIDCGQVAHNFAVKRVHIDGISGGVPTGFTTAGILIDRSFYGLVQHCDVSYCAVGILGTYECNGNAIVSNSVRQNNRGILINDTTANSEGNYIAGNAIETATVGQVAGIEIAGADSNMIIGNRIEVGATTPGVLLRGGVAGADRNIVANNNIATGFLRVGNGSGSVFVDHSTIVNNTVNGNDGSNNAILLDSDARYTKVDANRRQLADGVYTISDSGTLNMLSYTDDNSFTLTLATGATTTPTAGAKFSIAENVVVIQMPAAAPQGTASGTSCTLTGLPAIAPDDRPISPGRRLQQLGLCVRNGEG